MPVWVQVPSWVQKGLNINLLGLFLWNRNKKINRNKKTHSKLEWENCYEKESGFYTTKQIYKFLENFTIFFKKIKNQNTN